MTLHLDQSIQLPDHLRLANRPHVGLDFGTHSTKIMLRHRDSPRGVVPLLDKPCGGYPAFTSPSVVHVDGKQIWFGTRAAGLSPPRPLDSLKARVLRQIRGESMPDTFDLRPMAQTALYWAWMLGRIRRELNAPINSVNFAAPMDLAGNPAYESAYLGVAHAAWRLASDPAGCPVVQGMSLSAARQRVNQLLQESVPPGTERPFAVLSESTAPLMSYLQNPDVYRGLYLLADMGAGTTEISMNRLHPERDSAGEQLVRCYSARTFEIGGDSFDDVDRQPEPRRASGRSELLEGLRKSISKVWAEGYANVRENRHARDRWKRLTLVLSGGGFRRESLGTLVRAYRPHASVFPDENAYDVRWHRPIEIEHFPPRNPSPTADMEQSFLAVSHGLSFERGYWPKELIPGSMPPIPSDGAPGHYDSDLRYGEGDN